MDKTINCDDFLSIFSEIDSFSLDKYGEKQLKLFMLQIDSKDFDYLSLKEALLEPVLSFAISRQKIKENGGKTMKISKEARNSFRDYLSNTGELGEILLYCLLESDLDAPKIISKLELKTSANDYVKGADGVHFKKIGDDYLIIFGESKTVKSIKTGIAKALQSIHDFKNGIQRDKDGNEVARDTSRRGIGYEKGLISSHLDKETFSEAENTFFKGLIYPTRDNVRYPYYWTQLV